MIIFTVILHLKCKGCFLVFPKCRFIGRSEFAFLKMHQKWLHLRPAYTSDCNFCVFHFRDIYINITLDWMRPCLQVLTNYKFTVTNFLWSKEASKVVAFKICIHLRMQPPGPTQNITFTFTFTVFEKIKSHFWKLIKLQIETKEHISIISDLNQIKMVTENL